MLGLYEDYRYKSEWKSVHLKQVHFIGLGSGPELDQKLEQANHLSSGVIFGRDLVNSPANVLTPGQHVLMIFFSVIPTPFVLLRYLLLHVL